MEDESLRQLVCSKLNLGLDVKHFEDDFMQDMVNIATYKNFFIFLVLSKSKVENFFDI